mmetsp:Transcript_17587/g.36120  ORF Transcript_17587/g.36120 Transcript_17587/m.36120 type:complete len:226 (-) Transcript_17587:88-765(-)
MGYWLDVGSVLTSRLSNTQQSLVKICFEIHEKIQMGRSSLQFVEFFTQSFDFFHRLSQSFLSGIRIDFRLSLSFGRTAQQRLQFLHFLLQGNVFLQGSLETPSIIGLHFPRYDQLREFLVGIVKYRCGFRSVFSWVAHGRWGGTSWLILGCWGGNFWLIRRCWGGNFRLILGCWGGSFWFILGCWSADSWVARGRWGAAMIGWSLCCFYRRRRWFLCRNVVHVVN